MARISKRRVREALSEHGGVVARVAAAFDVTRQTVYNWIEKYDLDEQLQDARDNIFDLAEANLFDAVRDGDVDVSKFVVTHMPVQSGRKWGKESQVNHGGGISINDAYETAADEFDSLVADAAARVDPAAVYDDADAERQGGA